MDGLSNLRSCKINPLQGSPNIFEILAQPWHNFLSGNQPFLSFSDPITASPSEQKHIGLYKCVINLVAMLSFRTGGWHIFFSSLWYRPHLYCIKKSLVWTDIEKTAPENISECSIVSLSEYELKKFFTKLRLDTLHLGRDRKKNSPGFRREDPQLIFLLELQLWLIYIFLDPG